MMRILFMMSVLVLGFLPSGAQALSCIQAVPGQVIESADLIGKAKILKITKPWIKDILQQNPDEMITFELIEIYKSNQETTPTEITAKFPNFMRTWGPNLREGQEGEFLFRLNDDGSWAYAGPGACTYLNEDEWKVLRKNAK